MANPISPVRPGDLIRADDFNTLIERLIALDARVTALEGAPGGAAPSGVEVTSVIPAAPRIGDEMRIAGKNFGFSTGHCRVFIDSTLVTAFKSGTDTLLVFDIPEIPGVPETGKAVQLRVENQTAFDARTINLLPRLVVLQGGIDVHFDGQTPTTPTAGSPFTLNFHVNSTANLPITGLVTPTVGGSLSGIQGSAQVLEANGSVNVSKQITVPANGSKQFSVRLTIPSDTAANTPFSFSVRVEGQGKADVGGPFNFNVGTPAPVPDQGIQVDVEASNPPKALSNDKTKVSLAKNNSPPAEVLIDTEFSRPGTFVFAISNVVGWTITSTLPKTKEIEIVGDPVAGTGNFKLDGKAHHKFSLFLTAPATNTAPAKLTIKVNEKGNVQFKESQLELITL